MNKEKVFIEGHVVGSFADTLGTKGKQIQIASGDIVDIDDKFIYKSIDPQKVKVPPFVAKKIDYFKKTDDWGLLQVMDYLYRDKEIKKWLDDKNNQETVARAWLDDYEVEKEKRYRISMPKARNYMNHAQFLCEKDGKIFWCGEWYPFKQLEDAGFGWVFDCEGVEVEEVEG